MPLRLTCFGGAESVTGSNFMVQGEKGTLLIDCGIEQGADFSVKEMYAPFPYDVPAVDAVVITHAHLDHVGRLAKLSKEGFRGKVYMTPPTKELTRLLLEDSVGILMDEARKHNLPNLYEEKDVADIMSRVETVEYHKEFEAAPGLSVIYRNTGHILGSGSVRIAATDGTSIALTGDIGNSPNPYLPDPEAIPDADVILMESVYGDRTHGGGDRVQELRDAIKRAIERGGAILIPAFSIERSQLMLYELGHMMAAGEIPEVLVYLDSPLAINVTEVYEKYGPEYFKQAAQEELHRTHELFKFPFLHETPSRGESDAIREVPNPKIIMAGAGMSHGGRIGRHEGKYLPDASTTLFIVGYQAPGSPGRMLQEGAPSVRLDGREVRVQAKIETFAGWSAHADRDGLLAFAESCLPRTHTFFTALGEPAAARFLAQRIHDYLGRKAIVPTTGDTWEITKQGVKKI